MKRRGSRRQRGGGEKRGGGGEQSELPFPFAKPHSREERAPGGKPQIQKTSTNIDIRVTLTPKRSPVPDDADARHRGPTQLTIKRRRIRASDRITGESNSIKRIRCNATKRIRGNATNVSAKTTAMRTNVSEKTVAMTRCASL